MRINVKQEIVYQAKLFEVVQVRSSKYRFEELEEVIRRARGVERGVYGGKGE